MNGDNPQQPDPGKDQTPWQYTPGSADSSAVMAPYNPEDYPLPQGPQEVQWTASEFIAHDKAVTWYALFGVIALIVLALVYLITRDIFSVLIISFLALLVGFTASRKPQVVTFKVDTRGVAVGQKFHPYSEFRSFALIQEGAFSSITFAPLKRFMVPLSIYYDPKDEDSIIEVLASHLPVEQREHDVLERLARRVRF
jgi:hypothetical protein